MLSPVIAHLEQLIVQIKASGAVAHEDARLDISTHSKSGYCYARLRSGSELSACGRVGSEKYLEVLATLQRRDKIAELTQAISSLQRADAIPLVLPEVGPQTAMSQPAKAMAMPASAMAMPAKAIAPSASVIENAAAKPNPNPNPNPNLSPPQRPKRKRRRAANSFIPTSEPDRAPSFMPCWVKTK